MATDNLYLYSSNAKEIALGILGELHEFATTNGFTLNKVRTIFNENREQMGEIEKDNVDVLSRYIKQTPSKREAYAQRVCKGLPIEFHLIFRVLAVNGAYEVGGAMRMLASLGLWAPGGSYRATTARIFEVEARTRRPGSLRWPESAFSDAGLYLDDGDYI